MSGARFDVFLSHNGIDKPVVEEIAERLEQAGIEPWLDSRQLGPGDEWQAAIVAGLEASAACAVCLGAHGMGDWEQQEVSVALTRAVHDRAFRVFLVLLPGLPEPFEPSTLPPLLSTRTWVDLRGGIDDPRAFERLVRVLRPATSQAPETDICPYRGLEAFEAEHAELFFGRDAEIQRLVERLKTSRFLAVLGPSGSGKSSLVRAGLIPALQGGALAGSSGWAIRVLKPGPHPLTTLAAHLLRLHPGEAMQSTIDRLREDQRTLHLAVALARVDRPEDEQVVWVVDQLEEVFTLCRDQAERQAFLDNLLDAASRPDARNVVVVTLRADFYPRCAAHPELAARLAANQYLVGPLSEEGWRQVIEEPARRAGLVIEDGLAEIILDDVARQPGALPLLEHALLELWRRRTGNLLTNAAYRAAGGVDGSLAQRADEVYQALEPAGQTLARQLMLRLTEPGEGTEDTRRRAGLDEVRTLHQDGAEIDAVLDALVESRLITTSRDHEGEAGATWVDVSHEALIRGWPRLREWLDEDRTGLMTHRRLTEAALDWRRLEHDSEALYGGGRLAEAESFAERHPKVLNELEREFLTTSKRRGRRRLYLAFAGTFALLLLFATLALWFRQLENEAVSRELASYALAQLENDPELSLLLALEGADRASTLEVETALRRALMEPQVVREWRQPAEMPLDPKGRFVVTRDGDELVVWQADSGIECWRGHAESSSWSPNGRFLALSGPDGIMIWDTWEGHEKAPWPDPPNASDVLAVGQGGRWILLRTEPDKVQLWDLAKGPKASGTLSHEGVEKARFSPDGHLAVTLGGVNWRLWRVSTPTPELVLDKVGEDVLFSGGEARFVAVRGREILPFQRDGDRILELEIKDAFEPVKGIGWSLDGLRLVTGSTGGEAAFFEEDRVRVLVEPTEVKHLEVGRIAAHSQGINDVSWNQQGTFVVTVSDDQTAGIWSAEMGQKARLRGHKERLLSATFVEDRDQVLTVGTETVRLWDVSLPSVVASRSNVAAYDVRFSPDGHFLSAVSTDGAWVWNVESGEEIVALHTQGALVEKAVFSPDSRWIATASRDGVIRVESLEGSVIELPEHQREGAVVDVAFSSDGQRLLAVHASGFAVLWDWRLETKLMSVQHDGEASAVALSPKGDLVISSDGGMVSLASVEDGEPTPLEVGGELEVAAFDPGGRRCVTLSKEGSIRLWRVDGDLVTEASLETQSFYGATFSPDSSSILVLGEGSSAYVWRPRVRDGMVELEGHRGKVSTAQWSRDGHLVLTTALDGRARAWAWRSDTSSYLPIVELPMEFVGPAARPEVEGLAWSEDGGQLAIAWGDGRLEVHACVVCISSDELLSMARRRKRPERSLTLQERRTYLQGR